MFSAGVACLRGLVALGLAWSVLTSSDTSAALTGSSKDAATTAGALTLTAVAALDVVLGLGTYFGRYWARVLLMVSDAASIVLAFVVTASGAPLPTLRTSLPHIALGILVLLALTSPRARQYTTLHRRWRRPS